MNEYFKLFVITIIISAAINDCNAQIGNEVNTQSQMQYINGAAFQKMITFNNVADDVLYKALDEWVVATYNTSSEVLEYKFENRLIQIVGIEPGILLFRFPRSMASLKYTLNIEVENNKLCFTMFEMEVLTELKNRYTLEMYVYDKEGIEILDKQSSRVKNHAVKVANILINSLEAFLVEKGIAKIEN